MSAVRTSAPVVLGPEQKRRCNGGAGKSRWPITTITPDIESMKITREHSRECTAIESAVEEVRRRFWSLWLEHRARNFELCLIWIGGNRQDAEDAMTGGLIKALRWLEAHGKSPEDVGAWLNRVLRNHCLDLHRRRKRWSNRMERFEPHHAERIESFVGLRSESAEELTIRAELVDRVLESIAALPIGLHEPLRLRVFESMRYEEIADRMDLRAETVRKRVQLARAALRAELARDDRGAAS